MSKQLDKTLSFTALDGVLPIKMLAHKDMIAQAVKNNKIMPVHIRMNITNRCNQKCAWCCRSNVDRQLEMPFEQIIDTVRRYKALGCKAVTISGGGEPLMHERINDIIGALKVIVGVEIGILTNGWFVHRISYETLRRATWIRVSLGDGRKQEDATYWSHLRRAVRHAPAVDWGFSYVVTDNPDFELIKRVIEFAHYENFIHVRIVKDISGEPTRIMDEVKAWLQKNGINDELAIYQSRASWEPGRKKCLIGLMRPIIDTDGYIYACCATGEPDRDYAHKVSVGTVDDIEAITQEQKCVDGSVCKRCFLSHYNEFLGMLLSNDDYEQLFHKVLDMFLSNVKHREFI